MDPGNPGPLAASRRASHRPHAHEDCRLPARQAMRVMPPVALLPQPVTGRQADLRVR